MTQVQSVAQASRARATTALRAVVDETRSLFHRLKRAAEELHAGDGLTAGQRGVLKSLQQRGSQTVPELARSRPVSRQHIQSLVNPMVRAGWVSLGENPRHARSKLVALTAQGEGILASVDAREAAALDELVRGLDVGDLEKTTATLQALGEAFHGAAWTELVESAREDR